MGSAVRIPPLGLVAEMHLSAIFHLRLWTLMIRRSEAIGKALMVLTGR